MEKTPKKHQLLIKGRKYEYSAFEDFIAIAQHFPRHYEVLQYLNSLAKSPQIVECQECGYCSEIPHEPDYIECRKPFQTQKTSKIKRKRAYCYFQCKSSSIVKIELNQQAKKERFEGEVSVLQKKKKGLIDEIPKLESDIVEKRKIDSDLVEGIKNLRKIAKDENLPEKIKELEKKHKEEIENLKKKHEAEIKDKNGIIDTLTKKIKDFKEQQTQLSKIEPQTKAESPATITQAQPPAMETTVEVKVFQKPVVVPDVSEEKKILCPKTNQEVRMKEQCKMPNCKDFLECKLYVQTIKERDG